MKFLPTVLVVIISAFSAASAQSAALTPAQSPSSTTTNLQLSDTSVTPGTVVTLTATVTAGTAAVAPGQVTFFDGKTSLGTAQLIEQSTSANYGKAILKLRLGIGEHALSAKFLGTHNALASASNSQTLTVTGPFPSSTVLALPANGSPLIFTATVTGSDSSAPLTGTVELINSSNSATLATQVLGTSTPALNFGSPFTLPLSSATGVVAVADFNGDGIPDLAVGNGSTIAVLFGVGNGTFTTQLTVDVPASSMIVGDFNQDGIPDLALANTTAGTITILLGNGDGSFAIGSPITTGSFPSQLVAADLNGDGIPDLVLLNANSDNLTVLLGKGNGAFISSPWAPNIAAQPTAIVVADLNGDGIPDIATASLFDPTQFDVYQGLNAGTVTVHLGKGDGTFQEASIASKGGCNYNSPNQGYDDPNYGPYSIAVADLNGDGIPDLVTGNFYVSYLNDFSPDLTVLLGKGDGTFTVNFCQLSPDQGYSLQIADFNGDGIPDLIGDGNDIGIVFGKGDGTFTQGPESLTGEGGPFLLADLNGDGIPDVATGGDTLLLQKTQSASVIFPGISSSSPSLVAQYSGNSAYSPNLSNAIPLNPTTSTSLTAGANPNPSILGESVQLSASLSSSTGGSFSTNGETISFYLNSTLLGTATLSNGNASLTTTSLPVGFNEVEVIYAGDEHFQATSYPLPVTVVTAPPILTSLYLTTSVTHSTQNQPVQLTATLSPFSGGGHSTNGETVSFYSNTLLIGTATLTSGVATLSTTGLHVGTTALRAVYSGDLNFSADTSPLVDFTVAPPPPVATTLTLAATPGQSTQGQAVQLTATLTPYSNEGYSTNRETVTFYSNSTSLGSATLSSGVATIITVAIPTGTTSLTAVYAGDARFLPSTAPGLTFTVSLPPATP
jgi:hypothetical protein